MNSAEIREMSRSLVVLAMVVPEKADKFIAAIHKLYNKLEMTADEIEGKKTSPVVARQKGYV